MIAHVERRSFTSASTTTASSSLRIRCKDFTFLSFNFVSEQNAKDAFESILKLTCLADPTKLYAFAYKPGSLERKQNGWHVYDPMKEFERMGTFAKENPSWRVTNINKDYSYSPTYPSFLVVPSQISDTVLSYSAKHRSKLRIPALSYYHEFNGCSITRCSQPMVGLKQNRSAQDEKLVSAIFSSTQTPGAIGASMQDNLIVDARPTTNAMAQTALGAGTENMENYKGARKVYLGIDNIHVMRESLNKVNEALRDGDISSLPPNKDILHRSGWLKYLSIILDGAILVANQVHFNFAHVLVHCSDGWDRTSQISSLAQIFLDPYFRTLDGFIVLVEKEWLSFGHRFAERSGHLNSEKHFVTKAGGESNQGVSDVFNNVSNRLSSKSHVKYTSPVFHQFLDCVYQTVRQFPDRFEYNERFLRRLLYHTYSCQYGTFLHNNEKERVDAQASTRTRSVWDYFLARRAEFVQKPDSGYDKDREAGLNAEERILLPNPQALKWWPELFGRTEAEMNRTERKHLDSRLSPSSPVQSPSRVSTPSKHSTSNSVSSGYPKFDSPVLQGLQADAPSSPKSVASPSAAPVVSTDAIPPAHPLANSFSTLDDDPYSTSLQNTSLLSTPNNATPSLNFPKTHIAPIGNTSTLYTTGEGDSQQHDISTKPSPYQHNEEQDEEQKPSDEHFKEEENEKLDARVYASFNTMTLETDPAEKSSSFSRRFF